MVNSKVLGYGLILLLPTLIIGIGTIRYVNNPTQDVFISTTTSVQNTGLLDYLIQQFEKETGVVVKYTAVGSGAAIELARDGEVDAVLVHAPDLEKGLIEDGFSDKRHTLWYNYFLIAGPSSDPAEIRSSENATEVFEQIFRSGTEGHATFYSRGDQSGTHLKELEIWNTTQYQPSPELDWYVETGTGMATTLTTANEDSDGYILTDIGTFATIKSSQSPLQLTPLYEQDNLFYNPYSYLIIDSDTTGTNLNTEGARDFLAFLQDPATDQLVMNYKIGDIVLFNPIGN